MASRFISTIGTTTSRPTLVAGISTITSTASTSKKKKMMMISLTRILLIILAIWVVLGGVIGVHWMRLGMEDTTTQNSRSSSSSSSSSRVRTNNDMMGNHPLRNTITSSSTTRQFQSLEQKVQQLTVQLEALQVQQQQQQQQRNRDITGLEKKILEQQQQQQQQKFTISVPPPFQRYEKVVIVTKVHWPEDVIMLQQSLCLVTAAYNRHVRYDIVVFTTLPWNLTTIAALADVVAPATVQVVVDSAPLADRVAALTGRQRTDLYARCNVTTGTNLTWMHYCTEPQYKIPSNLAYAWQAEFRARHLWTHPALKSYRYMLWLDSDAMCTEDWTIDPIQLMIDNALVLLYSHFPQGDMKNPQLKEKMQHAYNNRTVCRIFEDETKGYFNTYPCGNGKATRDTSIFNDLKIGLVHGFHHVTDLAFYRSKQNLEFFKTLIGTHQFSREWDDQIAVTIPAAVLAPQKAWKYNATLIHNGRWEGLKNSQRTKHYSYQRMWFEGGIMNSWPAAKALCRPYIKVRG